MLAEFAGVFLWSLTRVAVFVVEFSMVEMGDEQMFKNALEALNGWTDGLGSKIYVSPYKKTLNKNKSTPTGAHNRSVRSVSSSALYTTHHMSCLFYFCTRTSNNILHISSRLFMGNNR